jgi:hypothetical protein
MQNYSQRLVELITAIAVIEDRYAVDVLNNILAQPAAANGGGSTGAAATPKPMSE